MQVFVHFAILKGIEGGFLEGGMGCAEVGEQGREALTNLERVGHIDLTRSRSVGESLEGLEARHMRVSVEAGL